MRRKFYFHSLFETTQTLFWAVFGLVDLDSFELDGIKIFTRFWGMLMFGTYSVINIVVLLNLLIAMMNHSYQLISVSLISSSFMSGNSNAVTRWDRWQSETHPSETNKRKLIIWTIWRYAFVPGDKMSYCLYLWTAAAAAVYRNSFPIINFLISSSPIILLLWFDATVYVRVCAPLSNALVVRRIGCAAGTGWCRMEICQIKIVDKLFWRRWHMSATIQHYTSTEIALVHRAVDEEKVLRTFEND